MNEFEQKIKLLIGGLMSGDRLPRKSKGHKKQVEVFSKTVAAEYNYLKNYMQYGEEDLKTVKAFEELNSAIRKFERIMGMDWPIR